MTHEWRLVERDAKLYLRYSDTMSNEPKRYRNFWLMGRRYDSFGPDPLPTEGFAVRDCRNGVFEAMLNPLIGSRMRLTLAGDRKCDFTEVEDVPPPRTRQSTRWFFGAWQKFTKKEGWQAA